MSTACAECYVKKAKNNTQEQLQCWELQREERNTFFNNSFNHQFRLLWSNYCAKVRLKGANF